MGHKIPSLGLIEARSHRKHQETLQNDIFKLNFRGFGGTAEKFSGTVLTKQIISFCGNVLCIGLVKDTRGNIIDNKCHSEQNSILF